jgi:hypothetical protein
MKTSTRTRTYEVRIILVNTCDEESRTRHHCDDWTIIINFLKFILFLYYIIIEQFYILIISRISKVAQRSA